MSDRIAECWYNLPDGQSINVLEVTIPVKGRIMVPASLALEMDLWRDRLLAEMAKQRWVHHGTLKEMLNACLGQYERVASDALSGAAGVRDDMLVMLRAAVLVLESIVGDHLNHFQKNERIRGAIGVLERSIHGLREERFAFDGATFQRAADLFRWREPERRLRERIAELERQLGQPAEATTATPDPQF